MKVYVCAAELLLLYSLTEWGKWLRSYCSSLLSYVEKAITWTTQPGLCVAWQVVSERVDAVWETSDSQPSPWWQGSPSTSKRYECLSSFLLHLPSLVRSWNGELPHLAFPGLWQSSHLCVVSGTYHMEQNGEKWNASTTSVMAFFRQRTSQV